MAFQGDYGDVPPQGLTPSQLRQMLDQSSRIVQYQKPSNKVNISNKMNGYSMNKNGNNKLNVYNNSGYPIKNMNNNTRNINNNVTVPESAMPVSSLIVTMDTDSTMDFNNDKSELSFRKIDPTSLTQQNKKFIPPEPKERVKSYSYDPNNSNDINDDRIIPEPIKTTNNARSLDGTQKLESQLSSALKKKDSKINKNVSQTKGKNGNIIIKQLPYKKSTHFMINLYVKVDESHVEHVLLYFINTFNAKQLITFLKEHTFDGMWKDKQLRLLIADDDGDIDDDYPPPGNEQVIAGLGTENFYLEVSDIPNTPSVIRFDRQSIVKWKNELHKPNDNRTRKITEEPSTNNDDDDLETTHIPKRDGTCCIIL